MSQRSTEQLEQQIQYFRKKYADLFEEIHKVIVGQDSVLQQIFLSMFCGGHALLVGVPGLAKTLMINSLAKILDLSFQRIQFTPDLMPSDITGTDVLEEDEHGKRFFRFIPGPVFANIVLADEINRTPPKTQSALLEAMQEHKVTAGGKSYSLEEPFFVLATQNPIEQEGTYPLPEAQLDRFMFYLKIDYPSFEEEVKIVQQTTSSIHPELKPVMTKDEILELQKLVYDIPVGDVVAKFAVTLTSLSRPDNPNAPDFIKNWVTWGAGPRASQFLILAAKAQALLTGNLTPLFEDIIQVAFPVLRHRIILNFAAEAEDITTDEVIRKLIDYTKKMFKSN
ncbi:MAG: MoxR family ATPase [Calditrichia bacterium]